MSRHARIAELIAADRCVVLDGATGTELVEPDGGRPELDEQLWGMEAVLERPAEVTAIHRRYVDAGCDVVSTNTWGLPTALRDGSQALQDGARPLHWMDVARHAVSLVRAAANDAGRGHEVAAAFSLNADLDSPGAVETVRLLERAFQDDPPDLILLETLSLIQDSTFATVESLLATGLPVWLSFRRCRHGVCGVYGEHWGGPEGDAFGRAARRFEQMGVGALLVNCIPPDHVTGMVSWLRDFTDLPLGVYPNLGYLSSAGWRHEHETGGDEYARLALRWREEGAQIVGGCCGVGPEHIAAAASVLEGTVPGRRRPVPVDDHAERGRSLAGWTDARGRAVFPLDFPDIVVENGVLPPVHDDLLVWKQLYRDASGAHQRCLDIGCGAGLLTVQLARNGAAHVHAIDVDRAAVKATLSNAFRNGVADRVSAAEADLYPWVPAERYDLIVASLPQTPVDPFDPVTTHRPHDFWGRNLLDHLIRLLPDALAEDGVAYLVQRSIIGERRTLEVLDEVGFRARVLDIGFAQLPADAPDLVAGVEARSDAYHLSLDGSPLAVAYLLEVARKPSVAGDLPD